MKMTIEILPRKDQQKNKGKKRGAGNASLFLDSTLPKQRRNLKRFKKRSKGTLNFIYN